MRQGLSNTSASAAKYTDQRFSVLDFNPDEYRKDSSAGIAGELTVAGIPQVTEAGKTLVAGGVGYHCGEAAFSPGASSTFSDGIGIVKLGASLDSRGYGSASAGIGFQF